MERGEQLVESINAEVQQLNSTVVEVCPRYFEL